jgi:hypothetical protein
MLAAKRQLVYLGEAKHRVVFDYIESAGAGYCFNLMPPQGGRKKKL